MNGWLGSGWRVFDASPSHGKNVRDWISGVIGRHAGPADPLDAALVVAELFTNAVVYGPTDGRVLVGYCLWPGGARIFVCDGGGATTPRQRQVDELEEGGRGLHVVDAVATAWGSFRIGYARAVWCDLGRPLNAVAGSEASAWLRVALANISLAGPRPRGFTAFVRPVLLDWHIGTGLAIGRSGQARLPLGNDSYATKVKRQA